MIKNIKRGFLCSIVVFSLALNSCTKEFDIKAQLNDANFFCSDLRGANLKDSIGSNLSQANTSRATLPSGTLDTLSSPSNIPFTRLTVHPEGCPTD